MFDFIPNIWRDLHPMVVHFALGGLFMSFGFTLLARVIGNAKLDELSWILLLVGVLAAIPSAITGIVSHLPYEALPVANSVAMWSPAPSTARSSTSIRAKRSGKPKLLSSRPSPPMLVVTKCKSLKQM